MPADKPCGVTGTLLLVVELLPSWPLALRPQHFTPPDVSRAQLWYSPDVIDALDREGQMEYQQA